MIVVSILALTGIGVTAIWGEDLTSLFGAGSTPAESPIPSAAVPATGPVGRVTGTF